MRIAMHPFETERQISADQYDKEFLRRTTEPGDLRLRPKAICEVCNTRLTFIQGNDSHVSYFKHDAGVFCPTKEPAGRPYLALTPVNPDPEAARILRTAFRQNWMWHYDRVSHMVPLLSADEFLALVQFATERNAWAYRGLEERMIPRLLVLMADFAPWTSFPKNKREFWFHFFFESSVGSLDELWIRPDPNAALFRASYVAPASRRGNPRYEDLVKRVQMDDLPAATNNPIRREIPDFVSLKITEWFRKRNFDE